MDGGGREWGQRGGRERGSYVVYMLYLPVGKLDHWQYPRVPHFSWTEALWEDHEPACMEKITQLVNSS